MRNEELPQLATRLNELSEYYKVKAETNPSLKVWLDCLKGCALADVLSVLTDWPKSNARYPTGNMVLQLSQELAAKREAERAAANAGATIDAVLARAAKAERNPIVQLEFEHEWPKIQAILKQPKQSPRFWATLLRDMWADGVAMESCQMQAVREYASRYEFVNRDGSLCKDQSVPADKGGDVTRKSWNDDFFAAFYPPGFEHDSTWNPNELIKHGQGGSRSAADLSEGALEALRERQAIQSRGA